MQSCLSDALYPLHICTRLHIDEFSHFENPCSREWVHYVEDYNASKNKVEHVSAVLNLESVYGIEKRLEAITSAKRNRSIHFLSKDLKKDMYDDKDDPEEKKVLEYLIFKLLELHKAKVNLLDSLNFQRDADYVESCSK